MTTATRHRLTGELHDVLAHELAGPEHLPAIYGLTARVVEDTVLRLRNPCRTPVTVLHRGDRHRLEVATRWGPEVAVPRVQGPAAILDERAWPFGGTADVDPLAHAVVGLPLEQSR